MKSALITFATPIITSIIFVACSSAPKTESTTDAAAEKPATTRSADVLSTSEITDRYGLIELDGAANALKVIASQSRAQKNDAQGEAVIGCAVTGAQANSWQRTVQSLMDTHVTREREQYSADPKTYARDKSFETCASNCSCDAYARVLKNASIRDGKKPSRDLHEKTLLKLQSKASRLAPETQLACARKQTWFCGSDLYNYLKSKNSSDSDL